MTITFLTWPSFSMTTYFQTQIYTSISSVPNQLMTQLYRKTNISHHFSLFTTCKLRWPQVFINITCHQIKRKVYSSSFDFIILIFYVQHCSSCHTFFLGTQILQSYIYLFQYWKVIYSNKKLILQVTHPLII
jgi:hypothetical protein